MKIRSVFIKFLTIFLFAVTLISHLSLAAGKSKSSYYTSGTVTGRLIDEQSDKPLMYASVVLYQEKDSVMSTGTVSDEDGKFVIDNVSPGTYYLKIQFVGYPPQKVNSIIISSEKPVYNAGVIKISPTAEHLSEVVIEGARDMMEFGLDRRVINVGQELTAAGGTALELMENIPSINVDYEGNVSLRGSSDVNILVDGRPANLSGIYDDSALEQLPSEMIERIEVITNPSVRYDPDGTSGIINIVTKKEKMPGYNGMISLSAGNNNSYSGSINFNIKNDKFNFFGSAGGRFFNSDGWGYSNRTNWANDTSYLEQNIDSERSMNTYNIQLGADYHINKQNTLTFSSNYRNWERNGIHARDYLFMDDQFNQTNFFERDSDNRMGHYGFNHSLNYRKEFTEEFRELNVELQYTDGNFIREEDMSQSYKDDSMTDFFEYTKNDGDNYYTSLEIDYEHPFNEESKIEVGWQSVFRGSEDNFKFLDKGHKDESWVINDSLSNHFIYDKQRHSIYGIFSTTLNEYNIQAGLRFEQAYMQGEQLDMKDGDFKRPYKSYFPSAHIRRNFENNQSAQISYSKRISRPRPWHLNPFTRYHDPYNLRSGNPELLPEYIHSLELSYSKNWGNTTISPSIFYRYTEKMISRYSYMDDKGITYTTFENIGERTNYGIEVIASQDITSWWRINGNFSYFHRIIEGVARENEYTANSYSWTTRINNHINIKGDLSIQVSGNYRSPVVMLQGERKEMYSADIGLRYNILDNKGSVSLRVSDMLDSRIFSIYRKGENFEETIERKRRSRMIFLGFNYRIHDYRRDDDRIGADEMDTIDYDNDF